MTIIRAPKPSDVKFIESADHMDMRFFVGGVYRDGERTFRSKQEILLRAVRQGTKYQTHMDMLRTVYADICQQVRDFNAAVQPIDNGPFERVALAEATTRIVVAQRAFSHDIRNGLMRDDMEAAVMRLCKL